MQNGRSPLQEVKCENAKNYSYAPGWWYINSQYYPVPKTIRALNALKPNLFRGYYDISEPLPKILFLLCVINITANKNINNN